MDATANGLAATAGRRQNPATKTTQDHPLGHTPTHPEAGARAAPDAGTPQEQPEIITIQGFLAPERSFSGIHDLRTVTLDKPSGETDRPETAAFRVSRAASLDPGGAITGTDTERSQSLMREAAKLPSASAKMAFLRENRIAVVADYSITDVGNRHLLVIDQQLEMQTDDHHMILAFPLHMCLTLIVLHLRSSLAFRGLPQEDRLSFLRWKRQSPVNSHRQSRWFSLFN